MNFIKKFFMARAIRKHLLLHEIYNIKSGRWDKSVDLKKIHKNIEEYLSIKF